ERRGSARARSKIANAQIARFRLLLCPVGRVNKPLCKQADVESMVGCARVNQLLFRRKQIEKERRQSGVVERAGDELIARTVPAAAAAVREKDQRNRMVGQTQVSLKGHGPGQNVHLVQAHHAVLCVARESNSRTSSSLVCEK